MPQISFHNWEKEKPTFPKNKGKFKEVSFICHVLREMVKSRPVYRCYAEPVGFPIRDAPFRKLSLPRQQI